MYKLWKCHEFECEHEGCSSLEDENHPNMYVDNDNRCKDGAMDMAKKAGWKFVKRGGVRKIFCPTCFKDVA